MTKEFKQIGKGFWFLWAGASTFGIFFSMFVSINVSVFSPFSSDKERFLEGILQGVIFGTFAGLPLWLLLRAYSSMASWWLVISAVGGGSSAGMYSGELIDTLPLLFIVGGIAGAVVGALGMSKSEKITSKYDWIYAATVGAGAVGVASGAISSYLIPFADDTARGHVYSLIYLILIAIATGFVGGGFTGRIMSWALQPSAAEWD